MLQKQFEKFNDEIKIDGESRILREKRDMLKDDFMDYFPNECKIIGLDINKGDIEFVSQGSFKLGTTIKTIDGATDLDMGVIIPVDINLISKPTRVKELAKNAIEIEDRRIPIIKEPCITVEYFKDGENWLHIDFPIYAKYDGQLYLGRGKNDLNGEWELSDPHGLNDYIMDRLKDNPQLRRLIRYIKQWKQVVYPADKSNDQRPPSIGLTLKTLEGYSFGKTDLELFRDVLVSIRDEFLIGKDYLGNTTSATLSQFLPVKPYTDVFNKFNKSANRGIIFYNKISEAASNITKALNCDNEHDAAKYVVKVLGEKFEVPDKEVKYSKGEPKGEYRFG